jgi:hypothetical protein
MSDAIFKFRKPLRDITIQGHDSVETLNVNRQCEVLKCDKMTNEHWELLINNNENDTRDVYLCERHGNTNKTLQVTLTNDKCVIRDK